MSWLLDVVLQNLIQLGNLNQIRGLKFKPQNHIRRSNMNKALQVISAHAILRVLLLSV